MKQTTSEAKLTMPSAKESWTDGDYKAQDSSSRPKKVKYQ